MAKLYLNHSFQIHFIAAFITFGIIIYSQIIFFPFISTLSSATFSNIHYLSLIRLFLTMGVLLLIDLASGIHIASKVKNYDFHSQIRGDLVLLVGLILLILVFDIPSLVSLRNGLKEQTFRTLRFSNLFRMIFWIIRFYYITNMIKMFYAHDTIYQYEEFS